MRVDIITLHPALIEEVFKHSMMKRAIQKELVEVHLHNLREFGFGKHKQADDYAFGGGAGMVMMIEPIDNCIEKLKAERIYDEIIYMSPDGEEFCQPMANKLSSLKNIIILCGHYKGIDERIRQYLITKEISIGNYVLTGGELAAAVVVDAIVRLIPGVLNDSQSALSDSFQDDLISPPVYTKPFEYKGWVVPEILLSGHQAKIEEWKMEQSLERTKQRRPNLLK
ncbi:MAG: tRNA (guanosine(37)-N1)-methyltransferase TrmD [Bacteroidia bacterium]|jgi:tRNA (guanine37-N1)-methyltransferase|nr:tRNA (guanosine(37)-N1)-methyltransferase TrmD [Bacteroidia bacterium]